jgi:alpha-aminoadipic semialdehyde synthase
MSVDILPASIPLDASKSFSSALELYLTNLIGYMTMPTFDVTIPPELERATIASRGVLTDKHKWLQPNVDEFRKARREEGKVFDEISLDNLKSDQLPVIGSKPRKTEPTSTATGHTRKKRILMLGSGMVAAPAVDLIAQRSDIELIIGLSKTIWL